jgi:ribosomal subunit interface protein
MKITIRTKNIENYAKLEEYVQEKMDMLEKYLGSVKPIICDVMLEKAVGNQMNGEIYRAEANLELPGELLRVEKTEKDIHKAIDKVKDHMAEAIKRYKGKKFGI